MAGTRAATRLALSLMNPLLKSAGLNGLVDVTDVSTLFNGESV
jgi:hypothetical protein